MVSPRPAILATQRVGEPSWDRGVLATLVDGDHDELVALGPAHVDEIAPLEVGDLDRAPRAGLLTRPASCAAATRVAISAFGSRVPRTRWR